ncbi:ion transporter [Nisaea sp.]|uniref:ion transporter n=1 Tax=Nisaea sp. TaxID=2024842 RepID=UPI003B52B0F9
MDSLRTRVWRELDVEARPGQPISISNKVVMVAIVLSVAAVVLESEPTVRALSPDFFLILEYGFGCLFVAEYLARVWCKAERREFSGPFGRLKYMLTPVALIDLMAILPFLLQWAAVPVAGPYFYILRLLRVLRLLTLARAGPFTSAAREVWESITERRHELFFTSMIAFAMMIGAAALLYVAERDVQPEAFGSIPRAMWWAIATLTTVGYGDVYPLTTMGKIFAGLISLSGVGLVAMPAGIFASALSNAYQERKAHRQHEAAVRHPGENERHGGGMD